MTVREFLEKLFGVPGDPAGVRRLAAGNLITSIEMRLPQRDIGVARK
jgi:hypothetical protein